ncbi:MAG: hypothetical protein IPL39_24995 [Opitutaceae bacterium]|nr:hypothetical protein [Opitutaceae bacterium]
MQHAVKETLLYFHPPSTAPAEMSRLARTFMWHPVGVLSADWYGETKATLDLDGVVPAARPAFSDTRRIQYTYDNVGDVFGGYYATNYNIGWDNYLIDGRKFEASACGGWPPSVNTFVVSGAPGDYFTAEARAMGELNVRPHSMAGYSHAQHSAFIQLTENPYGSMSWRRFIDLDHSYLAAPYLPGTEQDARPRDDQHAWYYSVEQAYYFTANPWIRDWYAFIAEFRKTRLHQEDPLPDMETRALGHSLEHSLQAYRVTGDTELATLLAAYLENHVRPRQVQLRHGGRNHEPFTTADGVNHDHWDSPQIGFLSRFCANLLHEIDDRGTEARAQAAADVFQFLAGCIEWNYQYGNFSGIDATAGARAAVPGDLGSNVIEPQAWLYRHTGIERFWTHIRGFTSLPQSTDYGHRPFDVFYSPWDGDYYVRYYQYLIENPRTDTTPPAAVANLSAWRSGDTVTLRWTAPAGTDLARYHVVYANSPISATPTLATTATNWWAAKAVGTRLVPLPAATQQLTFTVAGSDPVYAAIYTFDSSDNMSPISNVAVATPGSPDTLPPSAPGSATATPAGPAAIAVAWSASTDNIGVAGYRVYRYTTLVTTTATTGFTDTGLTAGTEYNYHVVAFDSAGNESPLSATATAVAHDEAFTTYATWRAGNFSGTDLTNNTISGPLADPDGAGLTNLERFAYGLPARSRVASPVALTLTGSGNNQRLTLTFLRKGYAPGLIYVVEASTDLQAWTEIATASPGYPKSLQILDLVPTSGATRRFVRLRVTASP